MIVPLCAQPVGCISAAHAPNAWLSKPLRFLPAARASCPHGRVARPRMQRFRIHSDAITVAHAVSVAAAAGTRGLFMMTIHQGARRADIGPTDPT